MTEKKILIPRISGIDPDILAAEICGVQPMPNTIISDLRKESLSREELKKQGYEPVSNLGLMWKKEE